MTKTTNFNPLTTFKEDFSASIIVFLVALPLCLGIALASGAPLYAGLISGIVGGVIVGALSGSALGVSGPAAGLAVIILTAINELGSFEIFLAAVIIGGVLQIVMGLLRAGAIAYFFPSGVVHGMLAGIGILIFFKQIPHAVGYDADPEGDFAFNQMDGHNTFSELVYMFEFINYGAVIISIISVSILVLWETKFFNKLKFTKLVKGPLVSVFLGIALCEIFSNIPSLAISAEHLVRIPVSDGFGSFFANFTYPDFNAFMDSRVYYTGIVIAIVASIETLLCAEASDKLDTEKRATPPNRELMAQGVGNIVCGFIGGLPVTQVIIRSSVNQQSGAKSKMSAVYHGILLLICVVLIPVLLNKIPLAALAAILLVVGFKLARPSLFKKMYAQGYEQFIPFLATIIGILFTNLLVGIGIGLVVALIIVMINNYKNSYSIINTEGSNDQLLHLVLPEDVSFLNKAPIKNALFSAKENSKVIIDATNTTTMHHDIYEIITDFIDNASDKNILVEKINFRDFKEKKEIIQ